MNYLIAIAVIIVITFIIYKIMANTGYKGWTTLKKVTNDADKLPLDVNGDLCSVSGLPQATKANTEGQPDYVAPVTDYVTCPVSGSTDYIIVVDIDGDFSVIATCYDKSTLTIANAPVSIYTTFYYLLENGDIGNSEVTIIAGQQSKVKLISLGGYPIMSVTKSTVTPTSYGGGTIE